MVSTFALAAALIAFIAGARGFWGSEAPPLLPVGAVLASARVLEDGCHIDPAPGTVLEVLRSSGHELAAFQRSGRCRYSVTEGGPRRWVVETELGTVEVLGTIFTVDVVGKRLAVSVERGKVFVRSDGRAVTLRAGEFVELAAPPEPAPAPAKSPPSPAPVPPQPPEEALDARGEPVAPPPKVVPARGVISAAEVLRRAANEAPARGAARLEQWLGEAPRTADWAVVALRLGTLELERAPFGSGGSPDGRSPAAALKWFGEVLKVGAPPTAVEDASARRIEALMELGRRDEALRAAELFRLQWPQSAWLATLPEDDPVRR